MIYLFQGDSITDCGRKDQGDPYAIGSSYSRLLEAELMEGDEECDVMNCGISGNKGSDLLSRWKKDCLNLMPDILSFVRFCHKIMNMYFMEVHCYDKKTEHCNGHGG